MLAEDRENVIYVSLSSKYGGTTKKNISVFLKSSYTFYLYEWNIFIKDLQERSVKMIIIH